MRETDRHRQREGDRQTDRTDRELIYILRETDRHRQREGDRQTDRLTESQYIY